MFATTRSESPVRPRPIRQGFAPTGQRDAHNPALRTNPTAAFARLPRLPGQQEFLASFGLHDNPEAMPTRKTLVETIKAHVAAGLFTSAQTRWLADNTHRPFHLWKAVENLAGGSVSANQPTVGAASAKSVIEQWPVRKIARFVLAWRDHDESLVSEALIQALHSASQLVQTDWATLADTPSTVNVGAFIGELNAFIGSLCEYLNQHRLDLEDGFNPCCPFGFYGAPDESVCLGMAPDDLVAIVISVKPDQLNPAYWELLKLVLFLIDKHLQPMAIGEDVLDLMCCPLEDVEYELEVINDYLKANNLEDTEENLEQAISEAGSGNYMIECAGQVYYWREQFEEQERVKTRWSRNGSTIEDLDQKLSELPGPGNEIEKSIRGVALELNRQFAEEVDDRVWNDLFLDGEAPFMASFTPVFLESEDVIAESVQQFFDLFQQGGFEEEFSTFSWEAKPETFVEIRKRLLLASDHLKKIVMLGCDVESDNA